MPRKKKPKSALPRWLTGPDGKRFQRRKDETVAQAMDRQTRHLKKAQVVELVRNGWSIRRACAAAGYHHSTIYAWAEDDPQFASDLYAAEAGALGAVENAAFRKALDPDGHQDRKLILRARGGYAFQLPERPTSAEEELDPKDVEVELVDGDGNPLF